MKYIELKDLIDLLTTLNIKYLKVPGQYGIGCTIVVCTDPPKLIYVQEGQLE